MNNALSLEFGESYARIVDAPVGTICYRLGRARERLRQELGEDDLSYLNDPLAPMRQWNWLPLQQMHTLETRLTRSGLRRGWVPPAGMRPSKASTGGPQGERAASVPS